MAVGLLRPERARPALTVSQLALLIRGVLKEGLDALWVAGELSNVHIASSGHCYFTLKDDQAQVAAVMFRASAASLVFVPENGMEVVARGRVDFYARRGDLQLYVEVLEPRGLGALQLALEQCRARLEAEGLFAAERKRSLPQYPRCVGVVTALGGAAIRDILTVLHARWPACRILVRPVPVQGAGAAAEIAAGIADMDRNGDAEVLIVGRGGGSAEDLWAFNEEVVARAIAGARAPVISAVGHEIDYTIADLVADARAPTPTAAAEMAVPRRDDEIRRLAVLAGRLGGELRRRVMDGQQRADGLARRLRHPRARVEEMRRRVEELSARGALACGRAVTTRRLQVESRVESLRGLDPRRRLALHQERCRGFAIRLRAALEQRLATGRVRVGTAAGRLEELSPLRVLERGYSLVQRWPGEALVRDAADLHSGDELRLRFARGRARARVIGTDSS